MIRRVPDQTQQPRDDENRRFGRIQTGGTDCSLGEILDVSASGMRILRRGACRLQVGEETTTSLKTVEGTYQLKARIVYMRKVGFRRHLLGVELLDVDEQVRSVLISLARTAPLIAGFQPLPPMNDEVEDASQEEAA